MDEFFATKDQAKRTATADVKKKVPGPKTEKTLSEEERNSELAEMPGTVAPVPAPHQRFASLLLVLPSPQKEASYHVSILQGFL